MREQIVKNQLQLYFTVLLTLIMSSTTKAAPIFPLKLSANRKYLVDRQDKPFLIKEISAWGLIQALSEEDESAFIDSIKKKGFNTVMVSIISFDTRFADNPPNWEGISPFNTEWDFSTYNKEYFEHVDRFLRMAYNKNMLVLLVPCYLGYKTDGNQGWWDELLNPNNSAGKSLQYGQFLGKRYNSFTNLVWVAGGDNNGEGPLFAHMNNIILGIKQFDKQHLWTGHFDSSPGTNWPSGSVLYAKYIDIDGLYDFTESALGKDAPQYKTELVKYGKGRMIFQMDQSYEHDIPHGDDNENHQWIRRKNYDGLLSGCVGTSFSPGQLNNQCYVFTNWRPLMNTEGMEETNYCFSLFDELPWWRLLPDTSNNIIKAGRGMFGTINYICAAGTADDSVYVAYLPSAASITVNVKEATASKVEQWWYNPRTGERVTGFLTTNTDTDIAPPSAGDWVLVIDKTKHN